MSSKKSKEIMAIFELLVGGKSTNPKHGKTVVHYALGIISIYIVLYISDPDKDDMDVFQEDWGDGTDRRCVGMVPIEDYKGMKHRHKNIRRVSFSKFSSVNLDGNYFVIPQINLLVNGQKRISSVGFHNGRLYIPTTGRYVKLDEYGKTWCK
jgi:hypothetical protein